MAYAAGENLGAGIKAQEQEAVFFGYQVGHVVDKAALFGGGEEDFVYGFLAAGGVGAYQVQRLTQTFGVADVVGGKVELALGHGRCGLAVKDSEDGTNEASDDGDNEGEEEGLEDEKNDGHGFFPVWWFGEVNGMAVP